MNRQDCNRVIDYLNPKLTALGYECVEVEWDAREHALRVYIDHPQGIDMDHCIKVNSALIEDLELDQLAPLDYRLEVSSPGIERPLRTKSHFHSTVGKNVRVQLQSRVENRAQGVGKLLGIDGDDIVSLELPAGVWHFPFQSIRAANLVFDW